MSSQPSASVAQLHSVNRDHGQMTTYLDSKYELVWCYLNAAPRACFNTELLRNLNDWCSTLGAAAGTMGIKYHVTASRAPGIFSLGGDLDLFRQLALNRDRAGLLTYGRACIQILHANFTHFGQDVTTISLALPDFRGSSDSFENKRLVAI